MCETNFQTYLTTIPNDDEKVSTTFVLRSPVLPVNVRTVSDMFSKCFQIECQLRRVCFNYDVRDKIDTCDEYKITIKRINRGKNSMYVCMYGKKINTPCENFKCVGSLFLKWKQKNETYIYIDKNWYPPSINMWCKKIDKYSK